MPSTAILLILLFLITLPIPPTLSIARGHLSPSAFGFPIALSFIPRSAFTTKTPRSWEVARASQALVTVWVAMGAMRGLKRTWRRIRGGSMILNPDTSKAGEGAGAGQQGGKNDSDSDVNAGMSFRAERLCIRQADITVPTPSSTFLESPLLTAIPLHLLSWRLATTLILPDLPQAWKWPFDATTLIGLGTGLICSWTEVWNLLSLFGLTSTQGSSKYFNRKYTINWTDPRPWEAESTGQDCWIGIRALSIIFESEGFRGYFRYYRRRGREGYSTITKSCPRVIGKV